MIYSMTAFARSQEQGDWGGAVWELRSVNHRYLEIQFRLPEFLRELELSMREKVHQSLQRGKVECFLRFQPSEALGSLGNLNRYLVDQLSGIIKEVDTLLPHSTKVNALELLAWPGVLEERNLLQPAVREALLTSFDKALIELVAVRAREGKALGVIIEKKLKEILNEVREVQKRAPIVLAHQREKLIGRLEEAKLQLDPLRLEQEMIYFVQRMDITEELDRLKTHVSEVERALREGGAVGRRLDFLMQELNREANTLASKSMDADIARSSIEIKVLIEQIREQVQNVE